MRRVDASSPWGAFTRIRDAGGRAFVGACRGSRAVTLAALATLVILPLVPGVLAAGSPIALLALPVESIAVLLCCSAIRAPVVRRVIAVFGVVVVVAIVVAALDLAFEWTVDRPFSPVDDWSGVVSAAGVVEDATGTGGVILIVARSSWHRRARVRARPCRAARRAGDPRIGARRSHRGGLGHGCLGGERSDRGAGRARRAGRRIRYVRRAGGRVVADR